jgi:hypothetical protein
MRSTALLAFLLVLTNSGALAQTDSLRLALLSDTTTADSLYRRKIIAWATPSKADEIDGISFCYFISPSNTSQNNSVHPNPVRINGMNVQVFPFAFMLAPYIIAMPTFGTEFYGDVATYKEVLQPHPEAIINGLNISQNIAGSVHIRGANINAGCSVIDEVHGFTVNGFTYYAHLTHGLSIATIRNVSDEMRGVQVGIYNKTVDLRGFQFGLWNVNGKRKLPLINWQFSK